MSTGGPQEVITGQHGDQTGQTHRGQALAAKRTRRLRACGAPTPWPASGLAMLARKARSGRSGAPAAPAKRTGRRKPSRCQTMQGHGFWLGSIGTDSTKQQRGKGWSRSGQKRQGRPGLDLLWALHRQARESRSCRSGAPSAPAKRRGGRKPSWCRILGGGTGFASVPAAQIQPSNTPGRD